MASSPTIVRLMGGLGNQLFQYAFGRVVSEKNGSKLFFDSRFLRKARTKRDLSLTSFRVDFTEAPKEELRRFQMTQADFYKARLPLPSKYRKEPPANVAREPGWGYHEKFVRAYPNGAYFVGYWQSFHYFRSLRSQLLSEFKISSELPDSTKTLEREIAASRSICVNVRRGDFASDKVARRFHGLMTIDYYLEALESLKSTGKFDRVYIFSDEPEWCLLNFPPQAYHQVVGHEHKGPHFSHYLHLMTRCVGFVIPNSTFGWWAAWLSEAEDGDVIAPRSWFSEETRTDCLIPDSWRQL